MSTQDSTAATSVTDKYTKTDSRTGLPLFALEYGRLYEIHFNGLLVGERSHGGGLPHQVDLTRNFISALLPQRAETSETRARTWLAECEEAMPSVEAIRSMVGLLRNKKRELSAGRHLASRDKVHAVTHVLNKLDLIAEAYCKALGLPGLPPELPLAHRLTDAQIVRAQGVLRELEFNQARLWPYLEERCPDEKAELDWIAQRLEQFRRALWVLKERFEAYQPQDVAEQKRLLFTLRELYEFSHEHHSYRGIKYRGIKIFLTELEKGPRDAVSTVLDSFSYQQDSRFDPLKYRWGDHEAADFQGPQPDEDFNLVEQAIEQLSPLGQSFVTTAALKYLLRHRLPMSAEWRQMRRLHQPYALCPLICRLDFSGKPAVTPESWPFETNEG